MDVTACCRVQRLEAAVRDAAEAQSGAARQLPNAVGDAIEEMEAAMSVRPCDPFSFLDSRLQTLDSVPPAALRRRRPPCRCAVQHCSRCLTYLISARHPAALRRPKLLDREHLPG
jgi:hypothetical protein